MMFFNILCSSLSALITYKVAKDLGVRNSFLVFVIIFFSPLYFKLIFSGLTEYLFGLVLILSIFLVQKKKVIFALVLVSFLPLIRSEGLLMLGVFITWIILSREYKLLPYVLTGQVFYSLIGAVYYKNLFWVISEIPYANLGSPYGEGNLFDFFHRLNFVIEKPIYVLLILGLGYGTFRYFNKGMWNNDSKVIFLIFASFTTFFVAHSIFWKFGIFNSMGLPRVLISVVPLIAVMALFGVEFLTQKVRNSTLNHLVVSVVAILIISFPFSDREQGVIYNRELFVLEENKLIEEEVAPFIKERFPEYLGARLYFSHPYLSMALDVDYFDVKLHKEIQHLKMDSPAKKRLIIWDEWFSVVEGGMSLSQIQGMDGVTLERVFQRTEGNRQIKMVVFSQDRY